eukprot:CAMPEP_0184387790 /NCGR_PEP_ID=MMETSP0007-20130409/11055_1 /TAXON_ID=97485 /ORGANISM="Prymnesium parvum, Strain Texoma1" /LENGTH=107 /DNA_ID=CAMNT_0026736361 /DNA_START=390 /DNA_END=710 /DNA_ORIENTATION=-
MTEVCVLHSRLDSNSPSGGMAHARQHLSTRWASLALPSTCHPPQTDSVRVLRLAAPVSSAPSAITAHSVGARSRSTHAGSASVLKAADTRVWHGCSAAWMGRCCEGP